MKDPSPYFPIAGRGLSYYKIMPEKLNGPGRPSRISPDTRSAAFIRPAFGLQEYSDLELSTQILIQAALKRGLEVEILDPSSQTIRLCDRQSGHSEIVVQATKTSKDSYLSSELMALKKVSKLLLAEEGLAVPCGRDYQSLEQARADWPYYQAKLADTSFIVKPNSTNFGIGISRLNAGADYLSLVRKAFNYDSSILIEEFIPGEEYRFLVISGTVCAVMHRIPANVTGDGLHNITQLVQAKNRDPWRVGPQGFHISPLETINLGSTELEVLQQQGLDPMSVPPAGEQIFLRHNSNISTGGDSLDMGDLAHPAYCRLAEACAKILGANICGVDLISTNITADPQRTPHAIIEANFNPVLYCHQYPAQGQPRPVADAVINLLFSS